MRYTKYITALFISLAASPLSAECTADFPLVELPPDRKQVIKTYLTRLDTTGSGIDNISDGALTSISRIYGVEWWIVFGKLLAAESLLSDLQKRDYAEVFQKAARYSIMGLLTSHSSIKQLSSVTAVTALAVLPIEIGLEKFIQMTNDSGFAFQEAAYRAARGAPYNLTHAQILRRDTYDGTIQYDEASGYFYKMVGLKSYVFRPHNFIDRDQLFELFRASYEAEASREDVRRQAERAYRDFRRSLASREVQAPRTDISGTWEGVATAGSVSLPYKWVIEQSGTCVNGVINMAMPGKNNWSQYQFTGELEGDTLLWKGQGWMVKNEKNFCLAAGSLHVSAQGSTQVLSGGWGFNPVSGGCPRGASGNVKLQKDP